MEQLTLESGLCSEVSTEYCLKHRDCYECGYGEIYGGDPVGWKALKAEIEAHDEK